MVFSGRRNLGTEGIAKYQIDIPISAYRHTNRLWNSSQAPRHCEIYHNLL